MHTTGEEKTKRNTMCATEEKAYSRTEEDCSDGHSLNLLHEARPAVRPVDLDTLPACFLTELFHVIEGTFLTVQASEDLSTTP